MFRVSPGKGGRIPGPQEAGRIAKLVALHGAGSPEALARIRRILMISRIDLVVLFLIIFDMSVKPAWGDLSLWVAIAGFAALAAILVRNGLNARLAAAGAEPARETV